MAIALRVWLVFFISGVSGWQVSTVRHTHIQFLVGAVIVGFSQDKAEFFYTQISIFLSWCHLLHFLPGAGHPAFLG